MSDTLLPGDPAENAPLVLAYREVYVALDQRHTTLFPGVAALLDGLAGRHLAIATSKSQSGADASVLGAGLTHHFQQIVGHGRLPRPKPFSHILELICETAGIPPSRAVMIGDTTFDLEMTDNAGVRAIGVAWGMHGPDRLGRWPVVHTVSELVDALSS
jgi:phosphoglycolate phosphatase